MWGGGFATATPDADPRRRRSLACCDDGPNDSSGNGGIATNEYWQPSLETQAGVAPERVEHRRPSGAENSLAGPRSMMAKDAPPGDLLEEGSMHERMAALEHMIQELAVRCKDAILAKQHTEIQFRAIHQRVERAEASAARAEKLAVESSNLVESWFVDGSQSRNMDSEDTSGVPRFGGKPVSNERTPSKGRILSGGGSENSAMTELQTLREAFRREEEQRRQLEAETAAVRAHSSQLDASDTYHGKDGSRMSRAMPLPRDAAGRAAVPETGMTTSTPPRATSPANSGPSYVASKAPQPLAAQFSDLSAPAAGSSAANGRHEDPWNMWQEGMQQSRDDPKRRQSPCDFSRCLQRP